MLIASVHVYIGGWKTTRDLVQVRDAAHALETRVQNALDKPLNSLYIVANPPPMKS